jgi:excisionase family DNA binding protein
MNSTHNFTFIFRAMKGQSTSNGLTLSDLLDLLAPKFKLWMGEAFNDQLTTLITILNPELAKENIPEYLTPEETGKLLGLSLPTLRKQTKAGIYTAYRVGQRKIQYRRSEIEKALQSRRITHLVKNSNSRA